MNSFILLRRESGEIAVRLLALLLSVMALLAASVTQHSEAAAPNGANVCLNPRDIERTQVLSDRVILFHMRNGAIWRNDLRTACPMLSVSSYTEKLTTNLICANQQFIHVTLTGDDCVLGGFTQVGPQR
jgi:hypothetical protein